ncbi:hypothetical protein [Paraliobacillus sp. JSM ZJ581]|uniref:hypothetical protein n=1 Tax=Paraliobacillus sp. JSM ZJ581 TaxID=3342118 RepID=UPI0035A90458
MSDEKKSVIIKEIHYWKENHLLPEKYCDYLLALYTQGDVTELESVSNTVIDTHKIRLQHVLLFIANIFILPVTFIVLYFTDLKINLQVSFGILMVVFSLSMYYVVKQRIQYLEAYSFFVLLLTLLMVSIGILQQLTEQSGLINGVAMIQLLGWLLIGTMKKRILLISVGFVGFVSSLLFLLF